MASLQAFSSLLSSSASSSSRATKTQAAIHVPKLPNLRISVPGLIPKTTTTSIKLIDELHFNDPIPIIPVESTAKSTLTRQLLAILDAVADRVQMHNNIRQQRDNWNSLLLNSINMITLTAAAMSAAAPAGAPLLGLKLSSTLLFSAATGMLVMVNKIQPSQLAEEQRNAARLFQQLHAQIQSFIMTGEVPTQADVDMLMEKTLALDRAYPLPLLGAMIEKFPKSFEPATWWPSPKNNNKQQGEPQKIKKNVKREISNGWSEQLEAEMREVAEIIKRKDAEDYVRLGNLMLKINKALAIAGPLLTGVAALSSGLVGDWPLAGVVAAAAGSLAVAVNAFEHGAQIGMVFEMYRNSAGFFKLLEDSIKATLEEGDWERRENGEVFERKVALKLGRSLSQLRELATQSAAAKQQGISTDEFASKLF